MSQKILFIALVAVAVSSVASVATSNSTDSCKGDPNAQPGCGINCGRLCSNYKAHDVNCITICLENGCDCKEGYVLDDDTNKCVLPENCTPVCGLNEESTTCVEGGCFDARNCYEISNGETPSVKCVKPIKCTAGCLCKDGYLRNDNGVCVARKDCPHNESCGGDPNAQSGCGTNCGRLCSNYNKTGVVACPDICLAGGCDCKDGYYFDENTKKCVLPKDCPQQGVGSSTGTCNGINEEWNKCPVICPPNTCESLEEGAVYNCPLQPAVCTPACTCKSGFFRNKIGDCISREDCLQGSSKGTCNGANEEWNKCPVICPPNTCESLEEGVLYNCPQEPAVCTPACTCKSGFFRNKIGDCISKADCLKCQGPHEYYSCGGACDNVCSTLSEQNQTNCPIINIKCNEMCYCEDGYARDDNGTCVLFASCPTGCNGDSNAKKGCGCNRTCADYRANRKTLCPKICKIGACNCNEGYVLEEKSGKCILPDNCPADIINC